MYLGPYGTGELYDFKMCCDGCGKLENVEAMTRYKWEYGKRGDAYYYSECRPQYGFVLDGLR